MYAHARGRIKAKEDIRDAQAKAEVAKAQGLSWHVGLAGVSIDTTALAYMTKHAAERWISSCVRKVCHTYGWTGARRQELRKVLTDFWSGKT